MEELVEALELAVNRQEDWDVAEHDHSVAAGNLDERLGKIEGLLRAAVDKLSEELNK